MRRRWSRIASPKVIRKVSPIVIVVSVLAVVLGATACSSSGSQRRSALKRKMIAAASAAAVVLLRVGGAVASTQVFSTPAPRGPAVITDQPGSPGVVDVPEPGDTPDGPGE
jgi:hypothetical protein